MAGPNQTQWAAALLDRLGIPQSKGALRAIVGWENAEGGHWHNDARFNPLNTTQPARGAGNTGTQGNIKVYRSWQQGLRATVKTLRNGRYGGILKALEAGNPSAVGQAIERSPWGTGGLAAKVIGSTRVGGATKPASALLSAADGQSGVSSTRSSDNMGGGADPLALLQALGQQRAPRQTAGLQAPAFSAGPAMPAGGMVPQGGMSPAPQPDIQQLLASIATPGEGIARTTVDGEATAGGGARVKGAIGGSPLAGVKPHKPTHETMGLPGYPAYDYMGKAGTPVVAPVSGKIVKLSGHDPKNGPTNGPHGPFGYSVYVRGDDGRTYYLTHLGSRDVKVGDRVKRGSVLGTIGNYAKWGGANHVHMGVHG